jgi:predicted kinase
MLSEPALVIVTGPPCSGKSHLAEHLAFELHLPLFTKDSFKETLFDVLGWGDRSWSQRMGKAAVELLYACAATELRVGRSCLLDAISAGHGRPGIRAPAPHLPLHPVEVHCRAEVEVLMERFVRRWEAGQRHPATWTT